MLTQEEFETLHLFVVSPLFNEVNRYHDTLSLFEFLKPHYPAFQHPDLNKDIAGGCLFPERKKPRYELEKAMSHLMRVLRQFITFQQFVFKSGKTSQDSNNSETTHDPISILNFARQQLALMRFYSERLYHQPLISGSKNTTKGEKNESENFFMNLYDKLKKEIYKQEIFTHFEEYEFSDLLYFKFLLEQEKALFDSLQEKRSGDKNLLTAMEALDQFYLLTKLDTMCLLIHQVNMAMPFKEDSDEFARLKLNRQITLQFVNNLFAADYMQSDGVILYSTLLRCLTHEDTAIADQAGDAFQQLLNSHSHVIPMSRLQDFKVILRSYWARRYRQTRALHFSERIFASQVEQLNDLDPDEQILASQMHNMLLTAVKLKKIEVAKTLLNELENRIVGTSTPGILKSVWGAMLHFEQKQIKEARKLLPHYYAYGDMEDIIFYAGAATLDVKICFELDSLDDDQHANMLRATSARIERDKTLTPEARKERERFFPLALRLYKLKQKIRLKKGNYAKDLDAICADIEATPVVHKEWLLEKCAEISRILKTENK